MNSDHHYKTDYEVGQDNVQLLRMELHNPVFFLSAAVVMVFVIGTLIAPVEANEILGATQKWVIETFHWLFMASGNFFVVFCLLLVVLPVGQIRLGGDDSRPEFSTLSWFAMLFAAGMGIGLMFWSVAEPVAHYTDWAGTPLNVTPRTDDGASLAMGATIFHWGLHAWAIYAVVALALAFFSFNRGLPFNIRSVMYPLLGEYTWRWPGHIIDTVAVLATVFGIATSLGFGAQQAAGGIAYLSNADNSLMLQLLIVGVVSLVATVSVVRGLDRGVKVLSNFNMLLALVLLLFVAISGPTAAIAKGLVDNTLEYLADIFPLSNWIGRDDQSWYKGWTVFYWAWWISWSPFVGMFIARISRGRTVREFVTAALVAPTLVSIVWMSVFGGTALEQARMGIGELSVGISDVSLSMFQMLEHLPLTSLASVIGVVLVLTFFITSADSGSIVLASISAGGRVGTPVAQRVFWVAVSGLIAAMLLVGGGSDGLSALQAAAITAGLPFCAVLLVMCVSLYLGLRGAVGKTPTADRGSRI